MHNCEEFRERITEHIIDREELTAMPEFQNELVICSACSEFYAESREMIEALSSVDLGISEDQWNGIEYRLQRRLRAEQPLRAVPERHIAGGPRSPSAVARSLETRSLENRPPRQWKQLLAAAALLVITIGLSRLAMPVGAVRKSAEPAQKAVYDEHSVSLDPVTVDFLEESELLLRDVMKIAPENTDDLADAKKTASEQLAGIRMRKEAAADVPPVVDVMNTYEMVLRDLRNVDERSAADDIPDIQRRIQKNALIANMKAFQTSVTPVSFRLQ
jgi:hypothetical protein